MPPTVCVRLSSRAGRRAVSGTAGRRLGLGVLLVLAAGLLPVAGLAQGDGSEGLRYATDVAIVGGDDGPARVPADVRRSLRQAASLISLQDEPPPSRLGLQRRATTDRERLQTTLRGLGYYRGDVTVTIHGDGGERPEARIRVATGPRYRLAAIDIAAASDGRLPDGLSFDELDLGIERGKPAVGQRIVAAQEPLRRHMTEQGYPFAAVADRDVVVRHGPQRVDVTYRVRPGPPARFGATTIEGLNDVAESLVRGRLRWHRGEPFDARLLDRTRRSLNDLPAIGTVRVEPGERGDLGPDGQLPVTVTVSEREPRFIGGEVAVATDAGLSLEAFWGHRNLFGQSERLRLSSELSQIRPPFAELRAFNWRLGSSLEKPDFLAVDQRLILSLALVRERQPGFRRRAVESAARLERRLSPTVTARTGLAVDFARVAEDDNVERTVSYAIPTSLSDDRRNDRLDATRGYYLNQGVTPRLTRGATQRFHVQTHSEARYYYDLARPLNLRPGRLSLASRVLAAATFRPGDQVVAADRRYYTGGGAQVRGYRYNTLAPLDDDDEPVGGLSKLETSLAVRGKLTQSFGAALFVDGGNAYRDEFPDPAQGLRFGVGAGLRYFSPVGPLRLDVAVPLNPRTRIERPFQLYISVGQAY